MFGKILIPLDGSELAELALPYAEGMVEKLGSELIILHVIQSAEDPHLHIFQPYFEKVATDTRCRVEKHIPEDSGRVIKVDAKILIGHTAEQIVDYTDSQGVDLIVMATHGRSGVRRWALGSVADKVIRATKQPVLLIRAKDPQQQIHEKGMLKRIVVPLDGSEVSEAILPYVEELAHRFNSELFLIVVEDTDFFLPSEYADYSGDYFKSMRSASKGYLEKASDQLSLKGISAKKEVLVGTAAEKIIAFANDVEADVIAMTTHGRSGVSRWVFGSITEKVLNEGTLPLLLVRAPGF